MTSSILGDFNPIPPLAEELSLPAAGVEATVRLLREGNTVPFIARYRKEATGGLDEVQIRSIQERHDYLHQLDARRRTILSTIDEQGALTGKLKSKILDCTSKTELEDLYLPFKPKRRTRASMARERGLEPLAQRLRDLPSTASPVEAARDFVDPERDVPDVAAALAGARDIIAEAVSESIEARSRVRKALRSHGVLTSRVVRGKKDEGKKFEQYFDYREPVRRVPSHRYLAMLRGEREKTLRVRIELENQNERLVGEIRRVAGWRGGSRFSGEVAMAVEDSLTRLLHPTLESEIRAELKIEADRSAVEVFANNLEKLLLAAPLGNQSVLGIDPGIRTGCKCVSVNTTGKLIDHLTIYPVGRQSQQRAENDFLVFLKKASPQAISG